MQACQCFVRFLQNQCTYELPDIAASAAFPPYLSFHCFFLAKSGLKQQKQRTNFRLRLPLLACTVTPPRRNTWTPAVPRNKAYRLIWCTGKDLTTHPFAAEINGCASPESILTVLQRKANELDPSRRSDERLTRWLTPTVSVLTHSLSPLVRALVR